MPKAPAVPATKLPVEAPSLPPPASFEEGMQELDALVAGLESGEMPLEQLLSGYQRGAALLEFCRGKLQAVEDQIKVLDDGVQKPWKAT
jgi:exodeoxyribonuclease VII small subunit